MILSMQQGPGGAVVERTGELWRVVVGEMKDGRWFVFWSPPRHWYRCLDAFETWGIDVFDTRVEAAAFAAADIAALEGWA